MVTKVIRLALVLLLLSPFTIQTAHAETNSATGHHTTLLTIKTAAGKTYPFHIDIAADDASRSYGLMNRKKIADDYGMLFLYDTPHFITMWMKDTYTPLDMLFIRENGTIAHIAHNTTPLSLKEISADEPCIAVLEIAGGISKKLSIQQGDTVLHSALSKYK